MHLIPGDEEDEQTEADIERTVAFLSDMDFVPVEIHAAD